MNRFAACLALSVWALASAAGAATEAPAGARIASVTRQVQAFSQREHALADALRKSDRAALDHLVAIDFEQRDGAAPLQPVPREQWLAANSGAAPEQMAVHDYGETAVVSFVSNSRTAKAPAAAFVVDVWRKKGEDWQLAVRYQSLAVTNAKADGDIKPTGKN